MASEAELMAALGLPTALVGGRSGPRSMDAGELAEDATEKVCKHCSSSHSAAMFARAAGVHD